MNEKVHEGEPMVMAASLQLALAVSAALVSGPPPDAKSSAGAATGAAVGTTGTTGSGTTGSGCFALAFAFDPVESPHYWHLRHCLGGTRDGLALALSGLTRYSDTAPVVWLAAVHLAAHLRGAGRDAGALQGTLLALQATQAVVSCLVANAYDALLAEVPISSSPSFTCDFLLSPGPLVRSKCHANRTNNVEE